MTDAYRKSPGLPLRQFVISCLLTALVLAFYAFKSVRSGQEDPSATIALLAAIAVGGGLFYWRIYKQAASSAAGHSVTLTAAEMLVRDGAAETRIPYSAIELVKVRRPLLGGASLAVKVSGLPADVYCGYEDMEGFIASLASHLPSDRVKGRVGHA